MRSWAFLGFIQQCLRLGGLRFLGALCTLLVNVVLARVLPAEEIGYYFVALGIAVFLAQISTLGSAKLLIKKMAESDAATLSNRVLSAAIILSFLGALGVYGLFIALSSAFGFAVTLPFYAVLGMAWFYIVLAALHGLEASWVSVASQYIVQPVLFLLLALYAPLNGSLIELYGLSCVVCIGVIFVVLRSHYHVCFTFAGVSELPNYARAALSYLAILTLGLAATHLMLPLASVWLTNEDVAVIGIVTRICNALFYLVVSVRLLLLPKFTKHRQEKQASIAHYAALGAALPVSGFVLALCVSLLWHKPILGWFGEGYAQQSLLLLYALLALFPAVVTGWCESYLLAYSQESKVLTASILASCVGFVALVPAVILFGAAGCLIVMMGMKSLYSLTTGLQVLSFSKRGVNA